MTLDSLIQGGLKSLKHLAFKMDSLNSSEFEKRI